jgi:hypothetical protein
MELPYDLAVPLLGMHLKEGKSVYKKDFFSPGGDGTQGLRYAKCPLYHCAPTPLFPA